jgi:hypothetical protein
MVLGGGCHCEIADMRGYRNLFNDLKIPIEWGYQRVYPAKYGFVIKQRVHLLHYQNWLL